MISHFVIDEHLHLENIKLSHAEMIFNCIDNDREHLSPWLPFVEFTQRIRDTELFIRSIIEVPKDERDHVFIILFDNQFAGLIGFKDTDHLNDKTEIGYWLCSEMTGKGIAIRATRKLINYAFNDLRLNRIQICCGVGNSKSAAIPQKLGFSLEGIQRDGEKHGLNYIDLEVYGLLKKNWVRNQSL